MLNTEATQTGTVSPDRALHQRVVFGRGNVELHCFKYLSSEIGPESQVQAKQRRKLGDEHPFRLTALGRHPAINIQVVAVLHFGVEFLGFGDFGARVSKIWGSTWSTGLFLLCRTFFTRPSSGCGPFRAQASRSQHEGPNVT